MSNFLELNLNDVRLFIQAFATLANSEDIDQYSESERDEIMAKLTLLIQMEDDMIAEKNRKDADATDIIGDEFKRFIQGA